MSSFNSSTSTNFVALMQEMRHGSCLISTSIFSLFMNQKRPHLIEHPSLVSQLCETAMDLHSTFLFVRICQFLNIHQKLICRCLDGVITQLIADLQAYTFHEEII